MEDTGIAPIASGHIQDPDLRLQIYMDFRSLRKKEPDYTVQQFCEGKEITLTILEEIVREFKSYDPTGERWG